ncbi:hypothetical protein MTO96_022616 [Rhipicephalus appendiculatus]
MSSGPNLHLGHDGANHSRAETHHALGGEEEASLLTSGHVTASAHDDVGRLSPLAGTFGATAQTFARHTTDNKFFVRAVTGSEFLRTLRGPPSLAGHHPLKTTTTSGDSAPASDSGTVLGCSTSAARIYFGKARWIAEDGAKRGAAVVGNGTESFLLGRGEPPSMCGGRAPNHARQQRCPR